MPEFAQPHWLWLLLALPLLIWLRWRQGSGVAESRFKRITGSVLRALALAALIIALAGPLAGSYSRHTDVVFVLDRSSSIDRETANAALAFIRQSWLQKDPAARMGLVVFGADAAIEVLVRTDSEPVQDISVHVERGGSDIGRALEMAIGAFPSGQQRRIVLLSDGQENLGQARPIAVAARSIGIEIIGIPLGQQQSRNEVRMQNLSAPSWVRASEPFEIQMALHSTKATRADLVLMRNGQILSQTGLELTPGTNTISMVEQVAQGGLYEYEAIINSLDDGEPENNRYQTFVEVRGAPRVLHAVGEAGWGDYVSAALRAQGLNVEEVPGTALPANPHELNNYDLVILNNVSGFDLSLSKMELLEEYVRDSGGGIITIGGDKSYAAGGYYSTPIENLLPVTMDLKTEVKIPSLAVIIVLDKSGSMSSPSQGEQKLAIAKRAALAAIELLNSLDRVGVLAFDDDFEWTVPPMEAANRRAIADRLRQLNVGGGTNMFIALQEAHRMMQQQQAKVKHLIVLSDGLTDTEADFARLSEKIAADGITISTVAFGSDADRRLMAAIAALGNGRFYYADNPQNIPRIFTSETLVVARNLVVEQDTMPILRYPGEMLEGFETNTNFPLLAGYQRTFPKPAAQLLLATANDDPLLVSWRYGLGKSIAFMSDLSGRWGRQWVSWPEFNRFITQLARWTMRRSGNESLIPTFSWRGKQGEILIDALDRDERFINGLKLQANMTGPEQSSQTIELSQITPGQYRGEFPVSGAGHYYFNISNNSAETTIAPATFGLAIPYSSEYLALGSNEALLAEIAGITGGELLPFEAASIPKVIASKPGPISDRFRIWWPFFLFALIVLVLEVAMRKINFREI